MARVYGRTRGFRFEDRRATLWNSASEPAPPIDMSYLASSMGVLRFHLLGFPVFVQPGFWLLTLFLGSSTSLSAVRLVMLCGALFASVLAHELGHAFAARHFGQKPVITLHMMGGLTAWRPARPLSRRATILVTSAGPATGIALGLVAFVALYAQASVSGETLQSESSDATWLLMLIAQVNIFWSLVNLLPVLPFDGGQILASTLGPSRRRLTATVSLVAGLLSGLVLWQLLGLQFAAIILSVAGISQFVAFLRAEKARPQAEDATEELLKRGTRALEADDYEKAGAFGRSAIALATNQQQAERAGTLTAWAAVHAGQLELARDLVRQLGDSCDVLLAASVKDKAGDSAAASELLERARKAGDSRPELAAQLIRLRLALGQKRAAAELAEEIEEDVPSSDLREVARQVLAEVPEASARLFASLFAREGKLQDAAVALQGWTAAGCSAEIEKFLSAASETPGLREAIERQAEQEAAQLSDEPPQPA